MFCACCSIDRHSALARKDLNSRSAAENPADTGRAGAEASSTQIPSSSRSRATRDLSRPSSVNACRSMPLSPYTTPGDDAMTRSESVLPFTRSKSSRGARSSTRGQTPTSSADLSYASPLDGGTGGDPGGSVSLGEGSRKLQVLQSATMRAYRHKNRKDSIYMYANADQTVVVFDWDDTLFPTTYIQDDLNLDVQTPMLQQRLGGAVIQLVHSKMSVCERRALDLLQAASSLAHVVVVTLASAGWVEMACENFYPRVGRWLEESDVPIVYAQERARTSETPYDKQAFQSDEEVERFWGLVKGRAISEEVEKFYSRYEGQSWKNILSVGDSSFERYGLLAATSAYMQDKSLQGECEVWSPTHEGCWQRVKDGRVMKLRAKCCKLVDSPEIDELSLELEMVLKWLDAMVRLDNGFDLDLEVLEDESQVEIIEAVLAGQLPPDRLPRSHA